MRSTNDRVLGRYDSLDALFNALATPAAPELPHGGAVRVHPALLPGGRVAELVAVQRRLEALGLRLVVTPAQGTRCVELRRYAHAPRKYALHEGGAGSEAAPPRG